MKTRKIIFGIIAVICIVAVNFSIYWQFFRKKGNEPSVTPVIEEAKIISDFNQLFNNSINYQGVNITVNNKIDQMQDLIYTAYSNKERKEDKYELNVNIPAININSNNVININSQIENIFRTKANNILLQTIDKTIYSVEYTAYINTNILSLVIKSTLKEGNNPQRVIVKTYNYNLSTGEELTLAQILEIKGLSRDSVENEIQKKIKEANEKATQFENLGYNVYTRDLTSNMYQVGNTGNYFLGEKNMLYIIYPYGNQNNTSEMDVILFE